jgi:hypothetical protein
MATKRNFRLPGMSNFDSEQALLINTNGGTLPGTGAFAGIPAAGTEVWNGRNWVATRTGGTPVTEPNGSDSGYLIGSNTSTTASTTTTAASTGTTSPYGVAIGAPAPAPTVGTSWTKYLTYGLLAAAAWYAFKVLSHHHAK